MIGGSRFSKDFEADIIVFVNRNDQKVDAVVFFLFNSERPLIVGGAHPTIRGLIKIHKTNTPLDLQSIG